MRARRILPDGAELEVGEAVAGLGLGELSPPDRPYVVLNMIATVDGRAAVGGGTRAISSETDRAVMAHLRTQADAVMVGAGTLRAERYGRLVPDPSLRDKRRREGLDPEPLACVVSGRLDVPPDTLFTDPESRVLLVTGPDGSLAGAGPGVAYERGDSSKLDLARVLARLRSEHGVRSLLCEGGPSLNAELLSLGAVDELFLTIAPTIAGGDEGPAIVASSAPADPLWLELVWVLEAAGELFLRYRARR